MRFGRCVTLMGVFAVGWLIPDLVQSASTPEFLSLEVSTAMDAQEFPVSVLKADGSLYVIWHDTRPGSRDIYGQCYDSEGTALWDPDGRPLVVLPGDQGWVDVVDDEQDGFVVVWGDSRGGGRDLYAQRFDALSSPQWQPGGTPVCVWLGAKEDHRAVGDGQGGVYVVWEDWRSDGLDIYGQHVAGSGSADWGESGIAICDSPGHQYDPYIASSGGDLFVAWWAVMGASWKAYAQRIGPDGRRLWGPDGVRVTTVESNQAAPVIVPDDKGGAYVVWADSRNDDGTFSNLDVYAQHILPDGVREWSSSGKPVCDVPGTQQQVAVVRDGAGGFYAVWTDSRDVYDDIYAARVLCDGSMPWGSNGVAVCVADNRQR